jgi:hypothetical protein
MASLRFECSQVLADSKRICPMSMIKQRPIRSGDKVVRDSATENKGTVRLGESAPTFRPAK